MSVLALDSGYTVKYNSLPSGVPSGEELNLTVYPLSCPIADIVYIDNLPTHLQKSQQLALTTP